MTLSTSPTTKTARSLGHEVSGRGLSALHPTYLGLPDIDYPFHDKVVVVTNCGRICFGHKKINFSTVFVG